MISKRILSSCNERQAKSRNHCRKLGLEMHKMYASFFILTGGRLAARLRIASA